MADVSRYGPTEGEVRRQLEKLEASRKFKNAARSLSLLRFLVETSLAGKKSDEREVGVKVWGYGEDWITDSTSNVRTGRNHLIQFLAEYYVEEGREDLVLIDTPSGTVYRAVWLYNPHSRSRKLMQDGLVLTRLTFLGLGSVASSKNFGPPREIVIARPDATAEEVFDRAIWYDQNNDAAVAGKAEAGFVRALFTTEPIRAMQSYMESLLLIDENAGWRARVLGAVCEAATGKWQLAYRQWKAAVGIKKPEEMDDVLSLLFLSATDIELAQKVCGERVQGTDGLEKTMMGLMAYWLRNYDEALGYSNEALAIAEANEVTNRLAELVKGLVLIARGALDEAFRALAFCFEKWDIRGFAAMALDGVEGEKLAECVTESPHASSLQKALGHLRLGRPRLAVNDLEEGLTLGDVWGLWFLDRWPLLEGLREDDTFQEMLERESSHKSRS